MNPKLSIVIPTVHEKIDSSLIRMAKTYPRSPLIEYLIIDQGTSEAFFHQLNRSDFRIFSGPSRSRAQKLQEGLELALGSILIFHHPRSVIDADGLQWILDHNNEITWGAFTHSFDEDHWGLNFTSFYSNFIRPALSQIFYLDHCLFFKRDFLDQEIPDIPIFEDTEICKILRRHGKPKLLPYISVTSAIRFKTNGFAKQAWLNQKMKLAYYLGLSKNKMNRIYEKNLNLNG